MERIRRFFFVAYLLPRSRWEMKIWRKSQGWECPVADGWFSVCCLLCKKYGEIQEQKHIRDMYKIYVLYTHDDLPVAIYQMVNWYVWT